MYIEKEEIESLHKGKTSRRYEKWQYPKLKARVV